MDVSKMTLSNFTLVRTSDSSQVNMEIVSTTPTSFMISPVQDLEYGTKYTARLSASLADSAGNFLDTNGDGYIWPDEPDLVWDFQLEDDSTTHGNPPTLRDAVLEGTVTVRVTFEESVTGDDVVMDASTFTAENIQVSDNIGAVPVVFETSQDPGAVNLQLQRAPQGTATLFLSCNLADQYGNLFDGNGNGMGGSPEEDNWSGDL